MQHHIPPFWKNLSLFQLLIICCTLFQHVAAATEEIPHDFYRHEVLGCKFQCVEGSAAIDRSPFYSDTLEKMDRIRDDIATITEKEKVTPQSTRLNIACFAFEFFDNDGRPIFSPFFFGHPDASVHIEDSDAVAGSGEDTDAEIFNQPHFFISGRLDDKKIQDAIVARRIEKKRLTYLPEPTTNSLYEYMTLYKKLFEQYIKLKPFMPRVQLANETDHWKDVKANFLVSPLEICWVQWCQERGQEAQKPENNVPSHVRSLLRIQAEKLRASESNVVRIIKSQEKNLQSDENIFQHSEQLGLARMKKELESFIKRIKKSLQRHLDSIGSIVLHVFSRNTVCARCASSIVLDFTLSFRQTIFKTLFGIETNTPFYVIAATKLPCSTVSRKAEGLDESVYKKIYDRPATGAMPLALYAGPKDCSRIYQICFTEERTKRIMERHFIVVVLLMFSWLFSIPPKV